MIIAWLFHGGPKDPKHRGRAHPLITFILHYGIVALVTTYFHDWMVRRYPNFCEKGVCVVPTAAVDRRQYQVAIFFGLYGCCLLLSRLYLRWHNTCGRGRGLDDMFLEFYRQTFLCSVTIFHSALGLYTGRPILTQAFCVAVGIDQLLWWIDLGGYILCRKFPIGVSKYLFWPGTTWASRITSTHHLWNIPLVLWASSKTSWSSSMGPMHPMAFPLSILVVLVNVLLSRLLTPHYLVLPKLDNDDNNTNHNNNNNNFKNTIPTSTKEYLNLNLAYELWPDIQLSFLRIGEHHLPYLLRLFAFWWTFNGLVYAFLSMVSKQIWSLPIQCN